MHMLHYLDEIRPVDEIEGLVNIQKVSIDNKEELSWKNVSTTSVDQTFYQQHLMLQTFITF
jgi:hypothetical protein